MAMREVVRAFVVAVVSLSALVAIPAFAIAVPSALGAPPASAGPGQRDDQEESDEQQEEQEEEQQGQPQEQEVPPLPEGSTLEQVLEYAAGPPPAHFPAAVADDAIYAFALLDQLEYRFARDQLPDLFGWEAQGWVGGDYNRFWWKSEGEATFSGNSEGEAETDLLYSRLISPFWSVQAGVQYANGWSEGGYDDRWSAVIALQGLAPYRFELDSSLYLSTAGDLTFELEAEYGIRITQRLVFQPRTELAVSAQEIPERRLGAGLTRADLDLRLRYEIRRKFAPYVGVRWGFLVGRTGDYAEASGQPSHRRYLIAGVRIAI